MEIVQFIGKVTVSLLMLELEFIFNELVVIVTSLVFESIESSCTIREKRKIQ